MKLVDELLEVSEDEALVRARVREDWPLAAGGKVPALVSIELCAQSAGVLAGWKRRSIERLGGRGWLVGVRDAALYANEIAVGSDLRIRIQPLLEMDAYAVYRGEVHEGESLLAEVELQVFRPADFDAQMPLGEDAL
ncbi:MAG: hypothetical protein JXR96_21720 [Deltaproteobacteria bacterium]|nr:hypothetical protein [Deltaproteobacteria bacterium]